MILLITSHIINSKIIQIIKLSYTHNFAYVPQITQYKFTITINYQTLLLDLNCYY